MHRAAPNSPAQGRNDMSLPEGTPPPDAVHGTTLRRTLGLPSAVFFGLAYMVPLTVFTTYGIVTTITSGHLPTAYIFTLTAMLVTALAYANMVKAFPLAGSAYTYTEKSFGPGIGFLAGWALLLDYLFLPMINFMVIGLYLNAALPQVPAWMIIIVAIFLVTGLNVLGIKVAAGLNAALLAIQALFIITFATMSFLVISGRAEPVNPLDPFINSDFEFTAVAAGAAILCLSFLGFDAVSTLSEETKDPRKTIPRAIVICTLGAGCMFVLISWIGHLVFPDWSSFTDIDTAGMDVAGEAGGVFMVSFFTAAYVSGALASAVASQVSVSRILFSMGRNNLLPPRIFGVLHPKFRTPYLAAIIVGVVSLLALVVPLDLASSVISFGALIAFTAVNLSVIKHYGIDQRRYSGYDGVKYILLPSLGVALCLWLWTSLSGTTFAVGLGWAGLGVVWLLVVTRGFSRAVPTMDMKESN